MSWATSSASSRSSARCASRSTTVHATSTTTSPGNASKVNRSLCSATRGFIMPSSSTRIDPQWAWQRYQPTAEAPWDLKRAGHLYRRAAFGGSLEELQAAVQVGPEQAISGLLNARADAEGD